MIVKTFEIKKKIIDTYNFFLMHGKNEGFKNEIIELNFIKNFDGQINKYDEVEFIKNKELIITDLLNKSFFDDKKILVISRATDKITKTIEYLINENLIDIKIIIKCSIIEKKSKLRMLFEKKKDLISIPFYEDDSKSLTTIVTAFIKKHKISLSRESINLLVSRASGDRENLKIELEKILNFSYSSNKIEIENIQKLTNLAENYSVSNLADSYLCKNKKDVSKILNENNYSDDDCILILRTVLAKSKRLLTIIEKYHETKNLDNVISNFKPPIFWKEKNNLKNQAIAWDLQELKNKIYKISQIEFLVKSNSGKSLNLVSDFIINF